MEALITILSNFKFRETTDRVISFIKLKGFSIFVRIDHDAEAKRHELLLRPTELILFGNPKLGAILMQDQQTCGIDLPLKILIWQDASETVWLTYNKMALLKSKHQLKEVSNTHLINAENALAEICKSAIGK